MRGTHTYTVRRMTILLVGILLLAMLVGLIIVTNFMLVGMLGQREEEFVLVQGDAETRLLNTTLERLPAATRDWSSWDETYAFAKGEMPEFAEKLTDYPMQLYGLNFVVITDTVGRTLYRYEYDYRLKEERKNEYDIGGYGERISDLTISTYSPDMEMDVTDTMQIGCAGFIINGGKLFYVSSYPILTSDEEGPPVGAFMFGREIVASEWQDLMVLQDATMLLLPRETAMSMSFGAYNGIDQAVFISDDGANVISCTPIKDIFGNSTIALLLVQPRELYNSGLNVMRVLTITLIALAAVVAVLMVVMLEKIVLKPLAILSGSLREIGKQSGGRVKGSFKGEEIRSLQADINDMLMHLELNRNELEMNNMTLKVYSRVLETAADVIILFNDDDLIEYVNRAAVESLGYSAEDMIGRPFNELIFEKDEDPSWTLIKRAISNGRAFKGEIVIGRQDDVNIVYEATVSPVMNEERQLSHVTAILRNISQKKQYEQMLIYIAQHDSLTDLPNRVYFANELKAAAEEAERDSKRIAVAHININGFKYVNEALGHSAGDRLLGIIAQRLKEEVKSADFIAHMGADEFMALLKSANTEERIESLVNEIFDILGRPFNLDDRDYTLTISIGSSVYPDDGIDAQMLMQNADLAMNKAKAMGGNHHVSYYEGLSDEISMRMKVDIALRKAIENNELVPFFQPIMDGRTGVITSCEALVRWISPTEGIIPPARFIPFATATGLIFPITEMMLTESLKSVRRFHDLGYEITVAVNVPVQVLLNREFMNTLRRALSYANVEPRYLNVEITEDTLVLDSDIALKRLDELREMQIGIAVDDFGTGYSSLSYLKRLSPQRVKIDKWFIGGIPDDEEQVAIVNAIIALAKSLGLYTTAEGVEFEAQRDYLTKQGCTHLQGYLISRPVPEDQFIRFLNGK